MTTRLNIINNAKHYCKNILDYCDENYARFLYGILYAECLKIYTRLEFCEEYNLDAVFTAKCEKQYNKIIIIDNFIMDSDLNTKNIFTTTCTCAHKTKPIYETYKKERTNLTPLCIKIYETDPELFHEIVKYKYRYTEYPHVRFFLQFFSMDSWREYPSRYDKSVLQVERTRIMCNCKNLIDEECVCECVFSENEKRSINKQKRENNSDNESDNKDDNSNRVMLY